MTPWEMVHAVFNTCAKKLWLRSMHFCLLVGQIYLEQLQNNMYCKSSFSNTVFIIIVSGTFWHHFGVVLHSVYHLDHRIVGEELTLFYSNCSLQFLVLLFNNNSLFCCYFVVFFARFSYRRIQFSCAAFHPLEACVATGVCGSGEIILWWVAKDSSWPDCKMSNMNVLMKVYMLYNYVCLSKGIN